MRISLLRSPTFPDQGEHHFTYSLLPYANGWNETVIAAAYALNNPLLVVVGRQEDNQSPIPNPSISLRAGLQSLQPTHSLIVTVHPPSPESVA